MRVLMKCSVVVCLLILVATTALAQTTTGTIRGVVSDPSKAVVPNATVTITNKATGAERKVTTNAAGEYLVPNLPPGEYEIKASISGFKTGQSEVVLQVGENISVDFDLQVGQQTETVVVTAETPAINTSDFKIDGVVNRKQIENLPLNGRNFLQLAMLEPGVTVEAVDNPGTSPNNFFRVSIAGASQAMTRISVDGATINDRVTGGTAQNFSQETVQEFQISTFNFDPSTSVTGVGSVNVVSRSGSNDVHGSAFFYFRDHNISAYPSLQRDARRFTNPSLNNPFFARRQAGGSIGGPIKKDKLFYFFNIENNNQRGVVPVANNNLIFSQFDAAPSQPLDARQANIKIDLKATEKHSGFFRFSTDNNDNYNTANGVFLPSNWVVTKNVSTQGLLGVTSIFTPNVVNDLRYSYGYYSGRLKIPTTDDCTDPVICIGLGGTQYRTTVGNFAIGNNLNTPQNRQLRTYQLSDTLSLNKNTHRIRFGGEWEHFYGRGSWEYIKPALVVLYDPIHLVSIMANAGSADPVVRAAALNAAEIYNGLPNSLKFNATFSGPLQPGLRPTLADIQRLPVWSTLFGIGDGGQPQNFRQPQASRNDRFRFFGADQWRIKPNFTLSYSLAWSMETNLLNHDLDRPAYLSAFFTDLGGPKRDYNNWDPSVGAAWSLRGGKTVIRFGGGIFHDSNLFWTRLTERAYTGPSGNGRYIIPGTFFAATPLGSLEFRTNPNRNVTGTSVAAALPTIQGILNGFFGNGTDLSVRGIERIKTTGDIGFGAIFSPDTPTSYSGNGSFGVQHEIAQDLVLQTDVVYRRTVHIGGLHDTFKYDANRFQRAAALGGPILPVCTGTSAATNPLDPRARCSNGAINVSIGGANYTYQGIHMKLDKRFSNRYLFTASYALSTFKGFNGVINPDNFFQSYGYQGSDRRHKFTFSGFMELPTYGGDNKFLRAMLNTYSFSTITQAISKPPLNPVIGLDHDGDGISTFLPGDIKWNSFGRGLSANGVRNLVANYNQTLAGTRTVRGEVYPSITLPANFDNGDTFFTFDIRLNRSFRVTERVALHVQGDAFNLLNVSNKAGYSGDLRNAARFGQPNTYATGVFGTGGPRAFQFAARLTF
ncbi:MAG TPA: carboxypeptidase regulatory-like domain-containing protein [Blastocatellia bacterium]|nr:carboxypeptidase regulatory-like domain-containing protein [Blastocatellia bacterium]